MKELVAGTNCTVIGWGKKEDKNCEFETFLQLIEWLKENHRPQISLLTLKLVDNDR